MYPSARDVPAVRVLLCASTRVYREGLADRLRGHADFSVVGMVATGFECIEATARAAPTLVLLDVGAPGAETAMGVLTRTSSAVPIVALAMPSVETEVLGWVRKGAAGFVT